MNTHTHRHTFFKRWTMFHIKSSLDLTVNKTNVIGQCFRMIFSFEPHIFFDNVDLDRIPQWNISDWYDGQIDRIILI